MCYDDDELLDEDDEEISTSHYEMKMIHYSNSGNEPLPGKHLRS